MYGKSRPLCTTGLSIPSLTPLELRKVQLEDIALGADLEEILDTVKMIRKDILKWNDIIARIFEQLGVKPKP